MKTHRKKPGILPVIFALAVLAAFQTGCGAGVVTYRAAYAECPRPSSPALPSLDEDAHVGGKANVLKILTIIDEQALFIRALGAALDCYDAQRTEGKKP